MSSCIAAAADPRRGTRRDVLLPVVLIGAALLFAFPRTVRAMVGEDMPVDDWTCDLVDQLRTRGVALTATGTIRPVSRAELADSLLALDARGDETRARGTDDLLAILRRELEPDMEIARRRTTSAIGGELALQPVIAEDPAGGHRHKAALRGSVAAVFGPHVTAQYRTTLDSNGPQEPTFVGNTWQKQITASSDVSAIEIHGDAWRVVVGRETPAWGAVREGMTLSDDHPPFDGVRASFRHAPFRFEWQAVELDPLDIRRSEVRPDHPDLPLFPTDNRPIRVRRFLSAHRVEWDVGRGLSVGVTEAVLYGGARRSWETYYLLPFVPYYSEQWNHRVDDNMMVGLNATWSSGGRRIAGELLLDDAQYSRRNEPQEMAGNLSVSQVFNSIPGAPRAEMEFTRVNPYVYGQNVPWNRWTSGHAVLGSPLGPDSDRWRFTLTSLPSRGWMAGCEAYLIRQGEMRAETPRPVRVPFLPSFPSGVVERRAGGLLSATWFASPALRARAWAGGEQIRNENHRPGTRGRAVVGVEMRLAWRFLRREID